LVNDRGAIDRDSPIGLLFVYRVAVCLDAPTALELPYCSELFVGCFSKPSTVSSALLSAVSIGHPSYCLQGGRSVSRSKRTSHPAYLDGLVLNRTLGGLPTLKAAKPEVPSSPSPSGTRTPHAGITPSLIRGFRSAEAHRKRRGLCRVSGARGVLRAGTRRGVWDMWRH
jgi:hypothetical protein